MKKHLLLLGFIMFFFVHVQSQIRLPKLVSNGMILQQNQEINIWGWASTKEAITISFNGNTYQTKANTNGEWSVLLPKQKPGGPHSMTISGENNIQLEDIFFGDVWLCSGQSNMELPIRRVEPLYRDEIPKIDNKTIRMFTVAHQYDFNTAKDDVKGGKWLTATQDHIQEFSALAYFFAEAIQNYNNNPIGIINCSVGGSPVEAWLSEQAITEYELPYLELMKHKDKAFVFYKIKRDQALHNTWFNELAEAESELNCQTWKENNFDDSKWNKTTIPSLWTNTELKGYHGSVWYRKTINISEVMSKQDAFLELGCIVDSDSVFVNGQYVGNTTYQFPPRWYHIDQEILKPGKNTITIKVISERGDGGFVLDKPYELTTKSDTISLSGTWKYQTAASKETLVQKEFISWKPCGLYNAMLHPLQNYAIKGVLWYQGEANTSQADQYANRLETLISSCRKDWGIGDFPFLIVQLANYLPEQDQPSESDWAKLREAQYQVTQNIRNTALVQASDLGIWNDIHPLEKKEIGKRAALAAKKVADHKQVIFLGPTLNKIERKGSKLELTFNQSDSGLIIKGDNLKGFAIAGDDEKYHWAKAKLKDNKIIIYCKNIKNPSYVKFAWEDNPAKANLYNTEGLPAIPFKIMVD